MRIPLLCILEPIKRGVDWLRKHFQQNIRFEPLLRPCTAEWIPRNVSLGPYNLGALTIIINPWAVLFRRRIRDWDTNYYLGANLNLMGTLFIPVKMKNVFRWLTCWLTACFSLSLIHWFTHPNSPKTADYTCTQSSHGFTYQNFRVFAYLWLLPP